MPLHRLTLTVHYMQTKVNHFLVAMANDNMFLEKYIANTMPDSYRVQYEDKHQFLLANN